MAGSGGWEQWEWDESLFAGAASYYEAGRLPYAPGLADALADDLGLDGRGRLLDVGCGPGTVARRLAPLFEAVVGVDPDPGMLAEAARLAAAAGIVQATWVRALAEALPAGLGVFRVITFGASFHWMDRPRVARAVRTMLTPGGAVVQLDAPGYRADALRRVRASGTPPLAGRTTSSRRLVSCPRELSSSRTAGRSSSASTRSSPGASRTRGPRLTCSGIGSASSSATSVRCSPTRRRPAGSRCGYRTTSCASSGPPDLYAGRMGR